MAVVDPEQLEREADEIIQRMTKPKGETETLAQSTEEEHNTDKADPAKDTSAKQEEDPAPVDSDSQADDESGDSSSESELEHKLRVAEERVKNAQSRMHRATQEAAELRKANARLEERLTALEQKAQAAEEPDLKSLEEDYPDIAKPLLAKIAKLEKQLSETTNSFEERQERSQLQAHFDAIRTAHPDFDDVATSEDFTGWLERQSPVWKRIAQGGTAEEVIELLSRFKEVQTPPKRADKARAIAEPKMPKARQQKTEGGSEKKIWTRDEINRMPLDQFEKYEAEIDRAMMEGRVR